MDQRSASFEPAHFPGSPSSIPKVMGNEPSRMQGPGHRLGTAAEDAGLSSPLVYQTQPQTRPPPGAAPNRTAAPAAPQQSRAPPPQQQQQQQQQQPRQDLQQRLQQAAHQSNPPQKAQPIPAALPDAAKRAAALEAAERRAKEAAARGTTVGNGQLAKELERQKKGLEKKDAEMPERVLWN